MSTHKPRFEPFVRTQEYIDKAIAKSKQKKHLGTQRLFDNGKCRNCWFLTSYCICSAVKPVQLKHRYITVFHPIEWTRASNTGRLITISANKSRLEQLNNDNISNNNNTDLNTQLNNNNNTLNYQNNSLDLLDDTVNHNDNSKLLVLNVDQDEEILANILNTTDHANIIVLFPSSDSISISQYLTQLNNQNNDSVNNNNNNSIQIEEKEEEEEEDTFIENQDEEEEEDLTITLENLNVNETKTTTPTISIHDLLKEFQCDESLSIPQLTIFMLDGTWNQAKNLNKRIPSDIKRVHLKFGERKVKALYNQLRRQPALDRISTLEATILLMKSIGEKEQVCNSLLDNLQLLINTLLSQSGYNKCGSKKSWLGDVGQNNQIHLNRNLHNNNQNRKNKNDNKDIVKQEVKEDDKSIN